MPSVLGPSNYMILKHRRLVRFNHWQMAPEFSLTGMGGIERSYGNMSDRVENLRGALGDASGKTKNSRAVSMRSY